MIYEQYLDIKKEYPDCFILIKVGNFYQTFDDDGVILNNLCGYKIMGRRVGFPVLAYSKFVSLLEQHQNCKKNKRMIIFLTKDYLQ